MLKYYDEIREIRDVGSTRRDQFLYWRGLLGELDPEAEVRIRSAINSYVDEKIREHGWTRDCWFCSSFIPGQDWRGKPYQAIYEAMEQRYGEGGLAWNQSRLFFGLLVKDVMIHRQEHWLCYKVPEKEEMEKGTNYFPDFSAGGPEIVA